MHTAGLGWRKKYWCFNYWHQLQEFEYVKLLLCTLISAPVGMLDYVQIRKCFSVILNL